MQSNHTTHIVCAVAAALAAVTLTAPSESAAYVNVYGGPTYVVRVHGPNFVGVSNSGTAFANDRQYDDAGVAQVEQAVRWDASSVAPTALGNLGTDPNGLFFSTVTGINGAGMAVGYANTFDAAGVGIASSAARWSASDSTATELGNLGTDPGGYMANFPFDINDAGTAVGQAQKYDNACEFVGEFAVRWDGSGTAPTELAVLYPSNFQSDGALAVNNAGTAVGYASRIEGTNVYLGNRAVRWDASGTAATELGNLGVDATGVTYSAATAISADGTAFGSANKYSVSGVYLGYAAVRWDASGTIATELGNLGTGFGGYVTSNVADINAAGTAVGYAAKFDESGTSYYHHAVRWDASGTTATELGYLRLFANGTYSEALAVNAANSAVGWAVDEDAAGVGERAVYWGLDGVAVRLDTLIDPASGWVLNEARDISDTGWIGGYGTFDPDGHGGQEAYQRMFLMHVPELSVLPGDFNHDGTVDGADYVVWRKTGGSPSDYTTWRTNFGQSFSFGTGSGATGGVPSGSSASADLRSPTVPEPTSAALTMFALACLAATPRPILRRSCVLRAWTSSVKLR